MKNTIAFWICVLTSLSISAQDRILLRSGDTLRVTITKSTSDFVEFNYPNESTVNQQYKNSIIKIIYGSGRIENCSGDSKLAKVNGVEDWEKVEITTNPADVRGLTKLGEVVGKSGWGGYGAQGMGNKEARKHLKKNAAKLGGSIVLIQEKAATWAVKLVGVAYK